MGDVCVAALKSTAEMTAASLLCSPPAKRPGPLSLDTALQVSMRGPCCSSALGCAAGTRWMSSLCSRPSAKKVHGKMQHKAARDASVALKHSPWRLPAICFSFRRAQQRHPSVNKHAHPCRVVSTGCQAWSALISDAQQQSALLSDAQQQSALLSDAQHAGTQNASSDEFSSASLLQQQIVRLQHARCSPAAWPWRLPEQRSKGPALSATHGSRLCSSTISSTAPAGSLASHACCGRGSIGRHPAGGWLYARLPCSMPAGSAPTTLSCPTDA